MLKSFCATRFAEGLLIDQCFGHNPLSLQSSPTESGELQQLAKPQKWQWWWYPILCNCWVDGISSRFEKHVQDVTGASWRIHRGIACLCLGTELCASTATALGVERSPLSRLLCGRGKPDVAGARFEGVGTVPGSPTNSARLSASECTVKVATAGEGGECPTEIIDWWARKGLDSCPLADGHALAKRQVFFFFAQANQPNSECTMIGWAVQHPPFLRSWQLMDTNPLPATINEWSPNFIRLVPCKVKQRHQKPQEIRPASWFPFFFFSGCGVPFLLQNLVITVYRRYLSHTQIVDQQGPSLLTNGGGFKFYAVAKAQLLH